MALPQPWQERIWRDNWREHLSQQRDMQVRVARSLSEASQEASRLIESIVAPDTVPSQVRLAQYRSQAGLLRQMEREWWERLGEDVRVDMSAAAELSARGDVAIAEYLVSRGVPADMASSFRSSVLTAAENVRSRFVNDISLARSVYNNASLASGQIDRIVNNGILLGKSAREIASDVVGFINPNVPGGQSYAAMRLARTELNNAYHTTSMRTHGTAPWVTGVRWVTSESHPRPDECDDYAEGNHDGLGPGVFKPSNVPGKPHPQCLCWTVTVTPTESEFRRQLLDGKYDDYMAEQGYTTITM